MQKNPIGWIEIPVMDIDRAEKFYADYFGFEFERQPEKKDDHIMSWFPMDMGSYGSACALMLAPDIKPSKDGPLIYFTAPKRTIEESLKKAESMGVSILLPKTDTGGHGFVAEIEDSEGNRIAIHSVEG